MTWSAVTMAITASLSRASSTAAGKPTALAVSRAAGSPSRFSLGSSGRFARTASRWTGGGADEDALGGQHAAQPLVAELQQALALDDGQELLGHALPRDSGHSRVPDPPAMMTPYSMC